MAAGPPAHAELWRQLANLAWVPIHVDPPMPWLPWPKPTTNAAAAGSQHADVAGDVPPHHPLATPQTTRPPTEIIIASAG